MKWDLLLRQDIQKHLKQVKNWCMLTYPERNWRKCIMIKSLLTFMFAAIMWVQVPQWSDDWSKCAVDVPDVQCHWYITAPDSTMGEGFSWANAPWFSVEGLRDVGELHDTMTSLQSSWKHLHNPATNHMIVINIRWPYQQERRSSLMILKSWGHIGSNSSVISKGVQLT